jgi:hypothetical protein
MLFKRDDLSIYSVKKRVSYFIFLLLLLLIFIIIAAYQNHDEDEMNLKINSNVQKKTDR